MPSIFVDIILLFSFVPLLTNPFTYYFMSKRYRAILYAYLSYCYWNKDTEKFNKKNQEARQVIKALRVHQQQNSPEYKQKINKMKASYYQIIFYIIQNCDQIQYNQFNIFFLFYLYFFISIFINRTK